MFTICSSSQHGKYLSGGFLKALSLFVCSWSRYLLW